MSRAGAFVLALSLAFASGWLFANEVRPPMLEDIGLAAWMGIGVLAVIFTAFVR